MAKRRTKKSKPLDKQLKKWGSKYERPIYKQDQIIKHKGCKDA